MAGSVWRERTRRLAILCGLVLGVSALPMPEARAAPASAGESKTAPSLARRLAGARLVVLGRIAEVEKLDAGKVALARIEVERILKGTLEQGSVQVLELRDLPSVAPLLVANTPAVAFLQPVRRGSYLRSILPAGRHHEPAGGRYGVITATSAAEAAEVAAVLERIASQSRDPELDADKRRAAARALLFTEIGGSHPVLVEDAALQLAQQEGLVPELTAAEQQVLLRSLRRPDLDDRIRALLIDAIGKAGLRSLAPALGELRGGGAAVHAARWRALTALGSRPSVEDLERGLGSSDAHLRAEAAAAYLRAVPEKGLERASRIAAQDPDPKVRQHTLAALGEGAGSAALPALERALTEDPDLATRQVAARVIFEIGGQEAIAALGRAAFTGPLEEQRRAVAMLRALGVGDGDPTLERVRREHPDPQAREIAEHGLPMHEH